MENFADAYSGYIEITPENERFMKTDYKRREEGEPKVLERWLDM